MQSPVTIIAFESLADAERPVAGVAAAARLIAEAAGSASGEVWLVLDDHRLLSARTRDDIARLPVDGDRLRWLSPQEYAEARLPPGPVLLVDGAYLVTGDMLESLAGAGPRRILSGDVPVAQRLDPGPGGDRAVAALPMRDSLAARRLLLKRTVKASDGLVSRYLNRPVSLTISSLVMGIPWIRPWHMTMVTAAVGIAMFLALLSGGQGGLIAGGLLYHCASVLDGVDGELARATWRSSRAGATLDTSVDTATLCLFFLGITLELGGRDPFFFTLGAAALALLTIGIILLAWLVRRTRHPASFNILKHFYADRFSSGSGGGAGGNPAVTLVIALFSRDGFAFILAMALIAGLAGVVLWAVAAAAALWLLLILAAAPFILRDAAAGPGGLSTRA